MTRDCKALLLSLCCWGPLVLMRTPRVAAFIVSSPTARTTPIEITPTQTATQLWETSAPQQPQQQQQSEIELYLAENFPSFYNLLLVNAVDVLKALRNPNTVFTIFAANDHAFERLGDRKLQQLRDPRNLETTNKIAAYHVVTDDGQAVTADMILDFNTNIGGVVTLAGGTYPMGLKWVG